MKITGETPLSSSPGVCTDEDDEASVDAGVESGVGVGEIVGVCVGVGVGVGVGSAACSTPSTLTVRELFTGILNTPSALL